MDDRDSKMDLNESAIQQDVTPIQKNRNIIEEIEEINRISRDPSYQTFRKSTYWNQQNTTMESVKQEEQLKEIIASLLRMENKLTYIETLLEKQE